MTASLERYAVLKISSRGEGLDNLRRALSARFTRPSTSEEPAPEAIR